VDTGGDLIGITQLNSTFRFGAFGGPFGQDTFERSNGLLR